MLLPLSAVKPACKGASWNLKGSRKAHENNSTCIRYSCPSGICLKAANLFLMHTAAALSWGPGLMVLYILKASMEEQMLRTLNQNRLMHPGQQRPAWVRIEAGPELMLISCLSLPFRKSPQGSRDCGNHLWTCKREPSPSSGLRRHSLMHHCAGAAPAAQKTFAFPCARRFYLNQCD